MNRIFLLFELLENNGLNQITEIIEFIQNQKNLNINYKLFSFKTDADTKWEDITIEVKNGLVVCIDSKDYSQEVNYVHMNMCKQDGNQSATWDLLIKFIERKGIINARINSYEKSVKQQKSLLCKKLRDYFGINEEPIYWDYRLRCYRTRFKTCYKK